MNRRHLPYHFASGPARLLAAIAASVLTTALFGAVAFGLTDDGSWSVLALESGPTVLSSVSA